MEHQENAPLRDETLSQQEGSSVNPEKEGHVKEWQDRARVVLNAKESVHESGSPKQSPLPGEIDDKEQKREQGNEASY